MSWADVPNGSLEIARAIMEAVRAKDPGTHDHCVRVSRGSRLLAKAAGLSEVEQMNVEFVGLFHDIGKIGVPDHILFKPGKLTPEEMEIMKEHPRMSARILEPLAHLEFFRRLIPGVLHHHERYDGAGYPEGLKGEEIPLPARIVLIADTFDAMTADRAYRKGLPAEVAYKELRDHAGRQFDPHLVKIYLEAKPMWNEKDEAIFREMNELVLKNGRSVA